MPSWHPTARRELCTGWKSRHITWRSSQQMSSSLGVWGSPPRANKRARTPRREGSLESRTSIRGSAPDYCRFEHVTLLIPFGTVPGQTDSSIKLLAPVEATKPPSICCAAPNGALAFFLACDLCALPEKLQLNIALLVCVSSLQVPTVLIHSSGWRMSKFTCWCLFVILFRVISNRTHPTLRPEGVLRVAGIFQAEAAHDATSLAHKVVATIRRRKEIGVLRIPRQCSDLPHGNGRNTNTNTVSSAIESFGIRPHKTSNIPAGCGHTVNL